MAKRLGTSLFSMACFAGLLTSCTLARSPGEAWTRTDRLTVDSAQVAAAAAECQAEAQLAAQRSGQMRPIILAQYPANTYSVGQPPSPGSYQAPQVDFSPMQNIGTTLGDQMRHRQLIQSVMEGCMAQKGYIKAP